MKLTFIVPHNTKHVVDLDKVQDIPAWELRWLSWTQCPSFVFTPVSHLESAAHAENEIAKVLEHKEKLASNQKNLSSLRDAYNKIENWNGDVAINMSQALREIYLLIKKCDEYVSSVKDLMKDPRTQILWKVYWRNTHDISFYGFRRIVENDYGYISGSEMTFTPSEANELGKADKMREKHRANCYMIREKIQQNYPELFLSA